MKSERETPQDTASDRELIVWCDDADAAAPLVEALRQGSALEVQTDLQAFAARIAKAKEARGLLLYLSPVETLCRAMETEMLPSAALSAWRDRAAEMLELNRRDRRRVQLLEIDAARRTPAAFRRLFSLSDSGAPLQGLPPQDHILELMADRVIRDDLPARRLQGELEAASLDCAAAKKAAETPDAAFHAYRDLRRTQQRVAVLEARNRSAHEAQEAAARQEADLRSALEVAEAAQRQARQDAELLKAQNQAVQEELEAAAREKLETLAQEDLLRTQLQLMKREMETLDQRLAQMGEGMDSYQAQVSALTAERDRLARRIDEKESSLAAAGAALRDAQAQQGHLTRRLDKERAARALAERVAGEKDAELLRILSSKSFRMTSPLRRLRALLSGGRAI